jgi:type VI protein secretion system component VasF
VSQSPEELESQIEEQREQLAGTIDALAAKLDVKSQAQAKVSEAKAAAKERTTTPEGKPRPELLAAGAALVVVVVALVWWRKR